MHNSLFPLSIYFAGALFNHKDIVGNALLADKIGQISSGRYECVLPQDVEARELSAAEIRNHDLLQILRSDGGLFNFDGVELDSGTVAEFLWARNGLDMPTVIWRGDFRLSGDQGTQGEPWNLMLSGYPRTEVVIEPSVISYLGARDKRSNVSDVIETIIFGLSEKLVSALDVAFATRPAGFLAAEGDYVGMIERYIEMAGAGLAGLIADKEINELAERKYRLFA